MPAPRPTRRSGCGPPMPASRIPGSTATATGTIASRAITSIGSTPSVSVRSAGGRFMTSSTAAPTGADLQGRPQARFAGEQLRTATISSLVALSLPAGLAGQAGGPARRQHKRLHASHDGTRPPTARNRKPGSGNGEVGYYEHVLEKAPFGSKRWWGISEVTAPRPPWP